MTSRHHDIQQLPKMYNTTLERKKIIFELCTFVFSFIMIFLFFTIKNRTHSFNGPHSSQHCLRDLRQHSSRLGNEVKFSFVQKVNFDEIQTSHFFSFNSFILHAFLLYTNIFFFFTFKILFFVCLLLFLVGFILHIPCHVTKIDTSNSLANSQHQRTDLCIIVHESVCFMLYCLCVQAHLSSTNSLCYLVNRLVSFFSFTANPISPFHTSL